MKENLLPSGPGLALPDEGDAINVYFKPPKKKSYDAKWLLLWQEEDGSGVNIMEQAKMEKPLTQTEYRVRDYITGMIGIGNFVYVNQSEVARELRLHQPDVSKAIKRLISLEIFIQGPKSGRNNTYMVNPAFCYSGNLSNGIKEKISIIKDKKRGVRIEFPKEIQ